MNRGILIDKEIMTRLSSLMTGGDPSQIQPCSYDLRIGAIFQDGRILHDPGTQVVVPPGAIVSLVTSEELTLPNDVAGTATAMNSLSSQGILLLNAGHVDPGYSGPLSVRLLNVRKTERVLTVGDPIITIVFEQLPSAVGTRYPTTDRTETLIRKLNTTDAEQNPRSLAQLLEYGPKRPVISEERVNALIRDHWISWAVLICTILGVLLAGIAAYASVVGILQAGAHSSEPKVSSSRMAEQTTEPDESGRNAPRASSP